MDLVNNRIRLFSDIDPFPQISGDRQFREIRRLFDRSGNVRRANSPGRNFVLVDTSQKVKLSTFFIDSDTGYSDPTFFKSFSVIYGLGAGDDLSLTKKVSYDELGKCCGHHVGMFRVRSTDVDDVLSQFFCEAV
jgi:hypothetical protein